MGRKASKKGFLEGLKYGGFYLVFIVLIDYFGFSYKFGFKFLIFSFIILFSSILGGMMGISLRKQK